MAISVALSGTVLAILWAFDFLPASRKSLAEDMDRYLSAYERSVSVYMENMVVSSQKLAGDIPGAIESVLEKNAAAFSEVSNSLQLISQIEHAAVPLLEESLRDSRATGAFLILNATLNTSLSKAAASRCGVYLSLNTPVNLNAVEQPIFWLRGLPQVASQYHFAFHNSWDMEFNISSLSAWNELLQVSPQAGADSYFFTRAHSLGRTWEKVILVCIPLFGNDGTVYGICGLEISSFSFRMLHDHLFPSLPGLTGMLALRQQGEDGAAKLDVGAGFQNGPLLDVQEESPVFEITAEKYYSRYRSGDTALVGRDRVLRLSPLPFPGENSRWAVAVLLPQQQEENILLRSRLLIAFCLLFFLLAPPAAARLLSAYAPARLRHAGKGESGEGSAPVQERRSGVLSGQDVRGTQNAAQVNLDTYHQFIRQIQTLTKTERIVFDLYASGLSSHEVAGKLNVSINTIRTHNRNIYAKLNVSSYKEMMIFMQMMKGTESGKDM